LIDGIDIGVAVPLNTAKVTNATHTGQVTGATALALDITAITAQPASGVLVGTDTLIVNDGGVLSEVTMDQIATFTGAGGAPVDSVFGRTGVVTALQADYDSFFLTPAEGNAAYGAIADVSLNTAKVTNATHTGQVTGATALALDITAVTAQPAAGALVGTDTFIVNDGGVLSEINATDMATFFAGGGAPVDSVFGRTGAVTALQADYDAFFLTPAEGDAAYGTIAAVALNTAKLTNVPTALSAGTITAITYGITSDGGADDIVLPEATTSVAGLLGAAKWDEIVANTLKISYTDAAAVALNTAKITNANHTGDVTGDTVLTIAAKAVDIAMLADGVDGELITWDALGVAATVPVGTATHVLTSNGPGVAPTFQVPTGGGVTDHTLLTNIGVNTHAQLDTHLADATLHFTEASIDHTAISNIGTNTHAQIDTHIADATLHFTEASIDHLNILNIGTNSHAAIDAHIAIAVTKVGTPVDNQIGVWTGDGTLEGDADFLWDGSGGANTALRVTAPVGLTSGYLVDIYADQATKTQAAVRIIQNDNLATADALLLQQNSTSSSAVALEVSHLATSSASYVARIRTAGVHAGSLLRLHHDNPSSAGDGLTIKVDGSGVAINVELGDIVTVDNVEAAQFIGDGSLLTGLPGGGDVTKVGTPVNNQIGVWTGDGTLEGEADLTYDGTTFSIAADLGITGDLIISATAPTVLWSETNGTANNKNWVMAADVDQFYIQLFNDAMSAAAKVFTIDRTLNVADLFSFIGDVNVTGDITLTGTVDGIDIATDVAANTAKVSNATHTGQVTGATALALDVTAVTAQPASGALVGTDTIIVNDGGTLSEATMDQVATFAGDTKRYVQVSGSGAAQVITGTPITMDLSVSDITTGAGDFTLAADAVTVINAGTYRISAQCTVADTDTAGSARTTIELAVEVNSSPVAGSVTRDYHRETEDNTGTVNFFVTLSANDVIRCRLDRLGATTNIQTIPTLCKLNIELIS